MLPNSNPSPALLAVLAAGLNRLEIAGAGRAQAKEVRALCAREYGLVYDSKSNSWSPVSEATQGFVPMLFDLFVDGVDSWGAEATLQNDKWQAAVFNGRTSQSVDVPPGTTLYLDPECTIPLRTL